MYIPEGERGEGRNRELNSNAWSAKSSLNPSHIVIHFCKVQSTPPPPFRNVIQQKWNKTSYLLNVQKLSAIQYTRVMLLSYLSLVCVCYYIPSYTCTRTWCTYNTVHTKVLPTRKQCRRREEGLIGENLVY